MEIRKIEHSDYVMFPRLQRMGIVPKHVERDRFKAELKRVERPRKDSGDGRKDGETETASSEYWLLYQQDKPHVVAHVQLPKTEKEFDYILGWCLAQNKWCEYIENDLSFICVIAGFNAEELTPKFPDFIRERVYALSDAARWWHEYGAECLAR